MTAHPFNVVCSCGAHYDKTGWLALELVGISTEPVYSLELRNCRECNSTISAEAWRVCGGSKACRTSARRADALIRYEKAREAATFVADITRETYPKIAAAWQWVLIWDRAYVDACRAEGLTP